MNKKGADQAVDAHADLHLCCRNASVRFILMRPIYYDPWHEIVSFRNIQYMQMNIINWPVHENWVHIAYTVKSVSNGHSKKTKIWFSRPIIASCRSKVLQNAPRGSFCNAFEFH